jgi:hypothetical protein
MCIHYKRHSVVVLALLLTSASVTSTAIALDAGGAASAASGAAGGAAGAAGDAAGAAGGAAGNAAGAATDAASNAAGTANGAANTATGAVSGAGRGLGGGLSSSFSARSLFGLETPDYGRDSRSVARSKGGRKGAYAYKPDHKPNRAKKDMLDSSGGEGVTLARRQRMCGEILSDPAGYDSALVQLCRRVSSR